VAVLKIVSNVSRFLLSKSMYCFVACLFATHVFAADIQNVGQVEQSILLENGNTKEITLESYELSDRAQHALSKPFKGQRQ